MDITKFTILKEFNALSGIGHLIFDDSESKSTLNELFDYLDQQKSLSKGAVDCCLEIKKMLIEIQTKTQFELSDYCLIDSRLRLAYGIGIPLVYGGTSDFSSIDLMQCCPLSQMLGDFAVDGRWSSIEHKAMSGVPELIAKDYIKIIRLCGAVINYSMDCTIHVRHPLALVGLQSTYILQDYFGSPANLGTLDTQEIKLLEDCNETFKKMAVSQELINFERFFQTESPDTRTRDYLNNRELS